MKKLLLIIFTLTGFLFANAQNAGNALSFVYDDHVLIPNSPSLNADTITVEMWVKPTDLVDGPLLIKYNSRGPNGVVVEDYAISRYLGHFEAVASNNGNSKTARQQLAFSLNTWYHIAAVFSSASVSLYVNGMLEQTVATGFALDHSSFPLAIGGHRMSVGTTNIDEVRIFNRTRTAAQIVSDMTGPISITEPGLVSYYNFNEGTAGAINTSMLSLPDLGPAANNGTLYTFALSGATSNWVSSYAMTIPSNLPVTAITQTSFTVNWVPAVFGAVDQYLIDVSKDPDFNSGTLLWDAGNGPSYTVTGLDPGAIYYYRLHADKNGINATQGAHTERVRVQTVFAQPAIASFENDTILGQGNVTITGTHFSEATSVTFGGVPAASFQVLSPTTISAQVGTVSASGNVTVTSPGGTASKPGFTFIPTPKILSFAPAVITCNGTTPVTLKGKFFSSVTQVSLMGMPSVFTLVSDSEITALFGSPADFNTTTIVLTGSTGTVTQTGFSVNYTKVTGTFIVRKGQRTTLTASGAAPFTWYDAGSAGNLLFTGAIFTTPTLDSLTHYWVSANNGRRMKVSVSVLDSMGVTATATPAVSGMGDTVRLNAVVPLGKVDWFTTPDGTVPFATTASGEDLIVNPSKNTTYYAAQSLASETFTFKPSTGYDGQVQTWTVPQGVYTIKVDMAGSRGGSGNPGSGHAISWASRGGYGGRVISDMNVTPGQVLHIFVGKNGNYIPTTDRMWNGGNGIYYVGGGFTGGGGDATDIRVNGTALSNRILVAGGGGGGSFQFTSPPDRRNFICEGGGGGGLIGGSPGCGGAMGGTQLSGGDGPGLGAIGVAGGGGGYYGGNTGRVGYMGSKMGYVYPGAGGSSYTDPQLCYNTQHTQGYWDGDGYVKITYNSDYNPRVAVSVTMLDAPVLISMTPDSAGMGQSITVKGVNFRHGVRAVTLGGTAVQSYSVVSDSVMTVTSGQGATGSLIVTGAGGNDTLAGFRYILPPSILSFFPIRSDSAGTTIRFSGSNMGSVSNITFGGSSASSLTAASASVNAQLGTGSSGTIRMTNNGGIDSTYDFWYGKAPGNALDFDGVDDHVIIDKLVTNDFTIEYWMKTTQTGPTTTLWTQGYGIVDAEVGGIANDFGTSLIGSKLAFGMGDITNGSEITIQSLSDVNTGGWMHVAITRKRNTGRMELYINGVLEASAVGSTNVLNASSQMTMGCLQTLNNFYKGSIDEVRIWNKVKTASEIRNAMYTAADGNEPALAAYYPFDKGIAGGANALSVTLPDMSFHQQPAGLRYFALSGNTSNWVKSDAMRKAEVTSFAPASAVPGTVVTLKGKLLGTTIAVKFGTVNATSFTIVSDSEITAVAPVTTIITGGDINVATLWGPASIHGFHFTGIPSVTSFNPRFGVRDSLITITGTHFVNVTNVAFGGVAADSFYIVSDTMIKAIIGAGASGEVRVTTTLGAGGLNGFLYSTVFNDDLCLNFDGVNDHITIPNAGIPHFFSIEFWMKTRQTGKTGWRWQDGDGIVTSNESGFQQDFGVTLNGNKLAFGVDEASQVFSVSDVNTGDWVHVAATRTYYGELRLYVNGVLEATGSGHGYAVQQPGSTINFGTFANVNYYKGEIDEIRLWNSVRTPADINNYKDSILSGGEPGLAGYYRFNQGSDGQDNRLFNVVPDLSPLNITAPLNNFALTGTVSNWVKSVALSNPKVLDVAPDSITDLLAPVEIYGKDFLQAYAVSSGGSAATSFTVVNDTLINAVFGNGAPGKIKVRTPGGIDSSSGVFFNFMAPPVLSSFTPEHSGAGLTITLTGKLLNSTTAVSIGGVPAVSFSVLSSTTLTAVVAPGAVFNDSVSVTTPYGRTALGGFIYHTIPVITSFYPDTIAGGDTITLTGRALMNTTGVKIGGIQTGYSVVSDSVVNAVVPIDATGTIEISTFGGTADTSGFVLIPRPVIYYFTPATANEGQEITVKGKYFKGTAGITLGGIAVTSFTEESDSVLHFTVPNTASGTLEITANGGKSFAEGFFYGEPSGNALHFNWNNHVTVPNAIAFNPSTITIEAWVRPDGSDGNIVLKKNSVTWQDYYYQDFQLYLSGGRFEATSSGFDPGSSNPRRVIVAQNGHYVEGIWYHVAAVFSQTSITLYVNGIFQQSLPTGFFLDHTANGIIIGSGGDCAIEQLRLFNTDRGPFVYTDMNAILPATTQGLIADYSFDQGTAGGINTTVTTLNDNTGHYPGSLNNFNLTGITSNWIRSGSMNLPEITSFSPETAAPGSEIVFKGKRLSDAFSVTLGGVPVETFVANSDSEIVAVIGQGATGIAEIRTAGGVGVRGGFTAMIPPVITSFSPANVTTGTFITITGTDFTGVTAVMLGGVPAASYTVVSITTITATVAPGTSGEVIVTTPAGTAVLGGYTYHRMPSIISVTPSIAPSGDTIMIKGNHFVGTQTLTIGGTPVAYFSILSDSLIRAVVGPGTSGAVSITTIGGTASLAGFTVLPQAVITLISPLNGHRGDTITLYGSGMLNTTAVAIGEKPVQSFSVMSDSVVTAIIDSGCSGVIRLTTLDHGTAFRGAFWYGEEPGNSLHLNANNWIDIPAIQSNSDILTMEFWVKTPTTSTSASLINKGSFRLFVNSGTIFQFGTGISRPVSPGQWNHVTIVYNRLTGAYKAYHNGFRTIAQGTDMSFDEGPWRIGGGNAIELDEIKLYSVDRIPDPIARTFNDLVQQADVFDTTLLRYYNFDIGVAGGNNAGLNTLFDLSKFNVKSSIEGLALNGNASNWVKSDVTMGPMITTFYPDTAGPGDTITITGKFFTNVVSVSIGGIAPSSYTVLSDSMIAAIIPLNGGASGEVKVTGSKGGVPKTGFIYVERSVITSFTPIIGGEATDVTIYGERFTGVTAVSIGGVPVAWFNVQSTNRIDVETGIGGISGAVSVTTMYGTVKLDGFTWYGLPSLESFAPLSAHPGDTITLKGSRFIGTTSVVIGGKPAVAYTVVSDSVIKAVIGFNTSGNVIVTTLGGVASLSGFTLVPAPYVVLLSPAFGSSGSMVKISGRYFTGVTNVSFGGTSAASFNIESDSVIKAYLSIGSSGNVQVTRPDGSYSVPGFTFYGQPVITSFSPVSAEQGATVTIKGSNFNGTTSVMFGVASAASFTVISDTLIAAVTGSGSSGSIGVSGPGGTGLRSGFSYTNLPSDNVLPVITHSVVCNNVSLNSYTITGVAITDANGINTAAGTRPRLYYKKKTDLNQINGNTSASQGWKYVESIGIASPFSFTVDYSKLFNGAVTGDTIQYFIIAQDRTLVPNTAISGGSFASAPASVNLVTANLPASVSYQYFIGLITPAVSITASQNTICNGTTVTYTATPSLGGASPLFQWKKNGANVATGSAYTTATLANNDTVQCEMTSNYSSTCPVATLTPLSNKIIMEVNPRYTINNPQAICNGGEYALNGHHYTATGVYRDTLFTIKGCDSIIVTQLTVNPVYAINNPQAICSGQTYSFNGKQYTSAGIYRDTLHTSAGCDSLIVTQLNVNPIYTVNNPQTICSIGSYGINGHVYTTAGTYRDTLHTITGCDSVIVTQLMVQPTFTINNPQTICNGSAYAFNGHTYATAGTYRDTMGCAIIVTQIKVSGGTTGTNLQTICSGKSYTFNGHSYATTGTYHDTIQTTFGCDSFVVTQLTVNPVYTTNNPQTICSGKAYAFNGHSYTTAGTYNDTLHASTGCDSIIVTQLTVNPVYAINNPQTICSGSSYTFNGHTYTTAATHRDTLHSVNGCDSIIATQLTVNPVYSVNNPQTICSGSSYSFNGHSYTIAASYRDTLHTINGCDSIVVTQLTVNPTYTMNNPRAICSGRTYSFNGHSYSTAGSYRDTLHSATGCDSIIVTLLNVNPTYNVNNPKTICAGTTYLFNGHTYTATGTYRDTLHSVTGCDSIIVTQLNVNPTYSVNNPKTICAGTTYMFNGHTYAVAGTYRDTLHAVTGCDSIIVTQLNVNPIFSVNNPQTICNGTVYLFNGHTYSVVGTYRDTLHAVTGCDSIIVTQLNVNPIFSVNNPQTICNGAAYSFNGHTYAVAGTYRDTLHAVTGCDSIIVTQLDVNPIFSVNNPQTICNGTVYLFNGHTYSVVGTYRDTLHAVTGCDSIIVTQLNVNPIFSVNNPQTICNSTVYSFNGHTYAVAGTYRDTLHSVTGCDSIIVTQLNVNPVYSVNNPQTICNGQSYTFNVHTYSVAGTYRDTLHTITGCDSIIVTQLIISPSYAVTHNVSICGGGSYALNGHTYTFAGTYRDTLHTTTGCDSIVVTQLGIRAFLSYTNIQAICAGSSYNMNGKTYSVAGIYYDTLQATQGCDSIVETRLMLIAPYVINNQQTICNGKTYSLSGHTYNTPGTYRDTLHSVSGCDSIIVTQLNVNPSYSANNAQTICAGTTYSFNGHTYNTTGIYRDTLHSVTGCDSIILTQLVVNPTYSINNPQTICTGKTYTLNIHAYSTPGTYRDTLHTVTGCDSIIVTQLNVNPAFSVVNLKTICAGTAYTFNGHVYNTAGTYSDTLHSSTGCDSIIVTQLNVNPTYSVNNQKFICAGTAFIFNGHTYNITGTYRDTLHSATGCDSVVVTQLTVNPSYSVNNSKTICAGTPYLFNGHIYTTTGTYRDTLHSVTGCDSIIVTLLNVNPTYTLTNPQNICSAGSYSINGHLYTTAGSYRDTLHSVTGCDSIIVTQLNITPTVTVITPQTICSGGFYTFNGHTYTTAGTYRDTLGCTIIVTPLTVNGGNTFNNVQSVCSGKSYTLNGHSYGVAGTYRDTLHTALGCDSFVVTQLSVNPTYSINNPKSICSGTSYAFNGHTYSITGTYRDTLHSVTGCDSIIVTQLNVNPTYSVNNPKSICSGTSYVFNGHTYSIAGTYRDTLHSVTGCDSIIVTQLNVNPTYSVNNPISICSGTSYAFNGHTYSIVGTYRDTLHSVTGCDSIIVTQLNVNPTYSVNNPKSICSGTSYAFNGHTYSMTGTYHDTLHSVTGCDSIIVTQLTLNAAPTATLSATGSTLFCAGGSVVLQANVSGGLSYKWLNNDLTIASANANSYLATLSGNYRVIITNITGCSDTSTVIAVTANSKPVTSAINGISTPQINSFQAYSVSSTVGSTYNWLVTNGTLISGANSNLIVVQWGAVTGNAGIKVVETTSSGCVGDTVSQTTNLAMPVELISFTATKKENHVELNWSTAGEENNDYFMVQRSTDGKQFEDLGEVDGKGTTTTLTHYQYIDKTLSTDLPISQSPIYYRLKQVDFDGKFEYSKIVVITDQQAKVLSQQLALNLSPNPFVDQAILKVTSAINQQATIRIVDGLGKVVLEQQTELNEGETVINLSQFANTIHSGAYVIQIITSDNIVNHHIIKAK